ncbi:MAG: flavodoxin [Clostridiales bacterium]|nr:flavodoxin [Clostridiales bacterium]
MSDKLVAFFSASGVTKALSERLSGLIGADLFEIVPEQIYTKSDLNWINPRSRSSVEMKDLSSRPAISSRIENIDNYKYIFVGFPVWWYRQPSIIDTFLESYNFEGKVIIPFCTSGSSKIGKSADNMRALAPKATVLEGLRFAKKVPDEELKSWAEEKMKEA